MSRVGLLRLHFVASLGALMLFSSFLVASIAAETLGSSAVILAVKHSIVMALLILVPTIATAGFSGRQLARGSHAPVIRRKLRRLNLIAATGILILIPCAITLERLAERGTFGLPFPLVQALELAGGAFNLALFMLNFRDGMAMRAKRLRKRVPTAMAQAGSK